MKMTGTWASALLSFCCTSRPLSPGRLTSSTIQPGISSLHRSRSSRALANVSTLKFAERIRPWSESRTETSSSTTYTGRDTSLIGALALDDANHPRAGEKIHYTLVSATKLSSPVQGDRFPAPMPDGDHWSGHASMSSRDTRSAALSLHE